MNKKEYRLVEESYLKLLRRLMLTRADWDKADADLEKARAMPDDEVKK